MKPKLLVFTCFCLLLSFSSCDSNNVIRTYNDEFRGGTKLLMNQYARPLDPRHSPVQAALITYEKEFLNPKPDAFNMYVVFSRGTTSFDVGRKGFIKIGDTIFDVEAKSMQTELKTGVNDTSTTTTDSTGTHTIASSETVQWLNDKFKIVFTPEMVAALNNSTLMTIRFYSGPTPVTFVVGDYNYSKLRELLVRK